MAQPDVMTPEQADAVFDQLENQNVSMGETVTFGDEFSPGRVNTVYPRNLPGQKVRIYCTRTGYPTDVLPYMLPAVMQMTWPDGKRKFSREQMVKPPVGNAYCFLHPDYPDRERVIAAGVADRVCSKPGPLLSVAHATRHAETRHSDRWRIYQGFIASQRDADRAEFERMQMEVMRRQLADTGPVVPAGIFYCEEDGCPRFFDNANALSTHRNRDHKEGA